MFARIMEGARCRAGRLPEDHERLDLSEGAPHGLEPASSKGGVLFATADQISDYKCALALQSGFPKADWLLADHGYDADWFRNSMSESKIRACVPSCKSRTVPIKYGKCRYGRRHRIKIVFGRIKDWRRVATRYDRCPKVFLSAIALAATVIYWLSVLSLANLQSV